MERIIECIPNFSEGANQQVINAIANAIQSVENVTLLHQDSGIAANRTVYTYAGEVDAVFEATYKAIKEAIGSINMEVQHGEHPRIGVCDVCPFVPISGISAEELIPMVNDFAERIAKELNIPIFLYEKSARSSNRQNLAKHRVGEYEALKQRISSEQWIPDFGTYNSKTGGTVMGVRNFLVAYNINLDSKDAKLAQEIAYDLRELGRPMGRKNGKMTYSPGALKKVKAIGWYIKDFDLAQVSINLVDYETTSLYEVYTTTQKLALRYNCNLKGSELIGLIPLNAILETGISFLGHSNATEDQLIQSSIQGLGLSALSDFKPQKRILEYALKNSK